MPILGMKHLAFAKAYTTQARFALWIVVFLRGQIGIAYE